MINGGDKNGLCWVTGLSPGLAGESGPSCRALLGLGAFLTWHLVLAQEFEWPWQPPHSLGVNFSSEGRANVPLELLLPRGNAAGVLVHQQTTGGL